MDHYKGEIPIIEPDRAEFSDMLFRNRRGLVQRDYSVDPPDMFKALPSSIVLIPKSEWDARFDEQEEQESSLEHLYLRGGQPAFVNLDQNGHGYCVTEDTEVLTEKGWVLYPQYDFKTPIATVNQFTHAMEFQTPFQRHVYEYDGPMMYSTNRRIDFGVTPDHQMYVRKWDERKRTLSSQYSFVKAGEIGWYAGLLASPSGQIGSELVEIEVPGDRRYDGDDFVAMMAMIVADGFSGEAEKTRNLVSFCCFDPKRYEAASALAHRVGLPEQPSRKGVWNKWSAGALAAWVRENCYTHEGPNKARTKKVPDIIKCLSQRQIKLFLQWYGDRCHTGLNNTYYTSSNRLADDLQELHLRIGKRSTISHRCPREHVYEKTGQMIRGGETWSVVVSETDRLCIDKKKHIETERYKGLVYCAAVPNHTLITRRNGSVLISSNCWAYSTGHAIMMDRLKSNQPLIRLNPHATAAIIKGGRDEGGWCGLSAKFAREVGYAVEGTGPGQWPLHSRSLKYDTPELRASMARYKVTEEFVDLTKAVYDQSLTEVQHATCLFNNQPCPSDFMWWSHSVCAIRKVRIAAGDWGTLILNSWAGWGRNGLAVLRGSQAIPDGALSILVSGASDK